MSADADRAEGFRQGQAVAEFANFIVSNQHRAGEEFAREVAAEMRRLGIVVVDPLRVEAYRRMRAMGRWAVTEDAAIDLADAVVVALEAP